MRSADIVTPLIPGAVGIIEVTGDPTAACAALCEGPPPGIGDAVLRSCRGIDDALITRPAADHLLVMPHGGPAVMRAMLTLLRAGGYPPGTDDPHHCFPEADDASHAQSLALMSQAASAAAFDLILSGRLRALNSERDRRRLMRFVHPPLIVLAGAPNIGKSTLANALAGRDVALTCDAPGTTRDALGVMMHLDGLTVRWLDTPGLRTTDDPDEQAAIDLARRWIEQADLLIAAARTGTSWPDLPRPPDLRIALAADLGVPEGADIETSAKTGAGLTELARRCRDLLIHGACP